MFKNSVTELLELSSRAPSRVDRLTGLGLAGPSSKGQQSLADYKCANTVATASVGLRGIRRPQRLRLRRGGGLRRRLRQLPDRHPGGAVVRRGDTIRLLAQQKQAEIAQQAQKTD